MINAKTLQEVTGQEAELALQRIAAIIKGELGFEANFTSTEQIVGIARDLLIKARAEGYFLAVKSKP